MFGRKEDPKVPEKQQEKPSNSMFSGMMMKKAPKPEISSSGYVPPMADIPPMKVLDPSSYKIPDYDPKPSTKPMIDSQEFSEQSKSSSDPFSDLKFDENPTSQKTPFPEKNPDGKAFKPASNPEKTDGLPRRPQIPGFTDDDEEDSLQFIKRSKLNVNQPEPTKPPEEIKPEIKKDEVKVEDEQNVKKTENRILRMLEEKKKKDAEERERREKEILEEKIRQEQMKIQAEEELRRKAAEQLKKVEEEKKKLLLSVNPTTFKEIIDERMKRFDNDIQDKVRKQAFLKSTNCELIEKIHNFQAKSSELESLRDQAAYQEDFEEADRIHEELECLRESVKSSQNEINSNSSLYSSLESEKSSLIESKKIWIIDTHSSRKDLLERVSSTLESNKSEAKQKRCSEQEKLSKQVSEKLVKKDELLGLQKSVLEKKTELEQRIFEKTEDLKQVHMSLSDELEVLLVEIKELEELLRNKKEKARKLTGEVETADLTLRRSLLEFDEEVRETEEAEEVVRVNIDKVEQEKAALDQQECDSKEEFELFLQRYNEKIQENIRFQQLLNDLEDELQRMTSLNKKREQFLTEIRKTEELMMEKATVLKEALEYSSVCKENIAEIKKAIKLQEEKGKDIEKKIPVLENDKKLAAAAKQFKEAAKFNNEIKEMNAEFLRVKESVQGLLSDLKEKEDELLIIEKNEAEVRAEILELQKVLEQTKEQLLKTDENVGDEVGS